ncbi:MAG: helix-turn-helix domain-containing protein [Thermoleophilaceae bacterium]
MSQPPDRPWEALPPDVAAALRPELPALADEIITAIAAEVPGYALPLRGSFGRGLQRGVEQALEQFVAMIENPGTGRAAGRQVYVDLGRGEVRAGRSLDALQAAYRLGARVAWRRLAAAGVEAGLEPDTLYLLAESIFAYIDELAAESTEGYAREQAAAAGERQRRRGRLVRLLIQQPAADEAAVADAAAGAAWALPAELGAVVSAGDDADRLASRLGGEAIAAPVEGGLCALIPDPDAPGRRRELEAALGDGAALGPTVPWNEAAVSFGRAIAAHRLAAEEVITGAGLVIAEDHAVSLLLQADRRLTRDLELRALAPLEQLTPAATERLTTTLRAWLDHQGRTEAVARALNVHPQTVRYRLARLRELFGDTLDDPDARFGLALALRSRGGSD